MILLVILLGLILWEVWICEGVHLGRGVVVWTYNLAAGLYDRIKDFDPEWERAFLGEPIAGAVGTLPQARLLDIGAGTGRTSRAFFPNPEFQGTFINLEPAWRMIQLGRERSDSRADWVQGWAVPLPIASASLDVVVSLEVLEFTPDPSASLREMYRVLDAGGLLVCTNRIGLEARLILGKTFSSEGLVEIMEQMGFVEIIVYPWQVHYDLVWARKPVDFLVQE